MAPQQDHPHVSSAVNPYYREYSDLLRERFGCKVQKISIDSGHPCPNRDGTLGRGGCIYCNNAAFTPAYTEGGKPSVTEQLQRGIAFFSRKYPEMRYLAYFQARTATNASVPEFLSQIDEARRTDGVAGIVIGTRPDCVPDELLSVLADINRELPVMVEFGAESSHDATLRRINRCHSWQTVREAVSRTAVAGIDTGIHLIMGLPGESREMMLDTVRRVNELPVRSIKFHQLQIVRSTPLAARYARDPAVVTPFTLDGYLSLCTDIVDVLRDDIAIDRFTSQTPADLLIAPRWGLKNHVFTARLHAMLRQKTGVDPRTPGGAKGRKKSGHSGGLK